MASPVRASTPPGPNKSAAGLTWGRLRFGEGGSSIEYTVLGTQYSVLGTEYSVLGNRPDAAFGRQAARLPTHLAWSRIHAHVSACFRGGVRYGRSGRRRRCR